MYDGVPTTAPAAVSPAPTPPLRGATQTTPRARVARFGCARAQILRQAPVDDDGLAERADQDVAGLEVAVDDALIVRVGDRLGGGDHAAAAGRADRRGVSASRITRASDWPSTSFITRNGSPLGQKPAS